MHTYPSTTRVVDYARCIEAALLLRSGFSEQDIATEYGKGTLARADFLRHRGLQETVEDLTGLRGEAAVKAAFSTAALPGILSNVAHKKLLKGYRSQPTAASKLCSIGDLTDFKPSERYGLTDMGDLEPVGPDGEIKHGGLRERKAVNQLETYGKRRAAAGIHARASPSSAWSSRVFAAGRAEPEAREGRRSRA